MGGPTSKRLSPDERARADAMKRVLNEAAPMSDGGAAIGEARQTIAELGDRALDVFDRAATGSKKRAERLVDVFLALGDAGGPVGDVADAGASRVLARRGDDARSALVQRIAFDPRRRRLAPPLRAIAADRSDPDWAFAVMTLGALADPGALDVLMDHTSGVETPAVVLKALVHLRAPEADLCFEPNLQNPEARLRTFALWGLAANGCEQAVAGLVDLLDDPPVTTATRHSPGEARRAAQGLADVHGWPFEWSAAAVEDVRARCAATYAADDLARLRAELAAGRLTWRRNARRT